MSTPYAVTFKSRNPAAPDCFPTIESAVSWVTGFGAKPWKYRGNTPLQGHYLTGVTPQDVPLEPYMVEQYPNTGQIIAKVDADIIFDSGSYFRAFSDERLRRIEESLRTPNTEWLHEKNREEIIARELESKRWAWL